MGFTPASFTPTSPLDAVSTLKPNVSMVALYSSSAGAKSSIHSNVILLDFDERESGAIVRREERCGHVTDLPLDKLCLRA
jgi:hypothetical protein